MFLVRTSHRIHALNKLYEITIILKLFITFVETLYFNDKLTTYVV